MTAWGSRPGRTVLVLCPWMVAAVAVISVLGNSRPAPAAPVASPGGPAGPAAQAPDAGRGHAAELSPDPAGLDLRPLVPSPGLDPDRLRIQAVFAPDPLHLTPGLGFGPFRENATGRDQSKDPTPVYTPEERRQLTALGKELFFSTTAWGQQPSQGPEVRGERLSCATCHSGPAFTDGRTHLVGPTGAREAVRRQTPHLFGLCCTAPFGWDGRNRTLQMQARGAITSPLEMHATREPTKEELDALSEFMLSLVPPPAQPGVDFDAVKAARGEKLFRQKRPVVDAGDDFGPNANVSCETCHSGQFFTDRKFHRISPTPLGDPADPGHLDPDGSPRGIDTPALIGIRFGSPFFHQGISGNPAAPTDPAAARTALRNSVLPFYNARFQFNFTQAELDDLTEFLLSL